MKKTHLLHYSSQALLCLITFFVLACGKDPEPNPAEVADKYLVKVETIDSLSVDKVKSLVATSNPLYGTLVSYGVKAYRITYKTKNTDNQEIEASGAIVIPALSANASAVPMVSYQHGTISTEAQAPSNLNPSAGNDAQLVILLAAQGYVAVAPDYIGYGASKNLAHTYEHRQGLSQASLDLLRAAKEYFAKKDTRYWDKRLYLTGYSEGGYATMSLLKKIEEEAASEFNLRAVSVGSGAYNKTEFMKYIVNNQATTTESYNRLYAWVLLTYNRIYGLNRPASYYFKEPYASQIPPEVKHQSDLSSLVINTSISNTFTDSFKKGLNDGTDTGFLNAVKDNDVYDWKPNTTLWMYHGTADDLVPVLNSQTAFAAMKAKGAAKVQYFPVSGANHTSAVLQYALGTLTMIGSNP
ncbi:lipase family protein [Siphonobacter sp. SORGH_AS_1065]|uniref:alpha/beta hydrolase n=1 Tax=Siphonobacter sp. SORGH_AS_1065 TaxID=3041795 RepID=UPI00277F2A5C|nr:lipase family protein [Siphonobacter sp. SORGH_AS_1065]MDQ1087226.1 dienelactone hydrolase [Siphonobacter sp. SORGH_AS_1065]